MTNILKSLNESQIDVIMPLHPRTNKAIESLDWQPAEHIKMIPPVGYLDLMELLEGARYVITDSGGLSRESFWAHKPSIVPMSAPPWVEIERAGWLHTVEPIGNAIYDLINTITPAKTHPEGLFGKGDAGPKIIEAIYNFNKSGKQAVEWTTSCND